MIRTAFCQHAILRKQTQEGFLSADMLIYGHEKAQSTIAGPMIYLQHDKGMNAAGSSLAVSVNDQIQGIK